MTAMHTLVLDIYEGDAAWAEPEGEDEFHPDEVINNAVGQLFERVFDSRPRASDRYVLWRIIDSYRLRVQFKSGEDFIQDLHTVAVRDFHHTVVSTTAGLPDPIA